MNASFRASAAGYISSSVLGVTWEKALYKGYTDATFKILTSQSSLNGIQGPTLRAEVGDMIEILFVNNLTKNYASMHSMGLSYTKLNEGSLYPNYSTPIGEVEQSPPVGDAVPPGQCYTYKWLVTNGASPLQGEKSKLWGYHSFVTMPSDLNAGLVGSTIVYPSGKMNDTMASNREFVLLYNSFDESKSFMATTNAAKAGLTNTSSSIFPIPQLGDGYGNYSVWHPQVVQLQNSMGILSSSQAPAFYSLNGRIYANNDPFEMCVGDKVIWYVAAYGSASHVFHMHGNGFVYAGLNEAAISINDGEMKTLAMSATATGSWQLICHVSDHLSAGMLDYYTVYPTESCPLTPLAE